MKVFSMDSLDVFRSIEPLDDQFSCNCWKDTAKTFDFEKKNRNSKFCLRFFWNIFKKLSTARKISVFFFQKFFKIFCEMFNFSKILTFEKLAQFRFSRKHFQRISSENNFSDFLSFQIIILQKKFHTFINSSTRK